MLASGVVCQAIQLINAEATTDNNPEPDAEQLFLFGIDIPGNKVSAGKSSSPQHMGLTGEPVACEPVAGLARASPTGSVSRVVAHLIKSRHGNITMTTHLSTQSRIELPRSNVQGNPCLTKGFFHDPEAAALKAAKRLKARKRDSITMQTAVEEEEAERRRASQEQGARFQMAKEIRRLRIYAFNMILTENEWVTIQKVLKHMVTGNNAVAKDMLASAATNSV